MALALFMAALIATCFTATFGQLTGSASLNPNGGTDINLGASKFFGKPDLNIGGGVFAAANSKEGVPTFGATGSFNVDQHSLGITKTHTPGVSDTISQNVGINFLNKPSHRLDLNLFNKHTKLNNGFSYDTRGGSLDYNHRAGHGLSLGASGIPNFGTTVDLTGKANLWTSRNKMSTFDLTGTASRSFDGPTPAKTSFSSGLSFIQRF